MATKFFPERLIFVPATGGHPPKTEYRIGVGMEDWAPPVLVKKTQMIYEGRIAGRVAPSFPVVSEYDETAVQLALSLLDKGIGSNSEYTKTVVVVAKLEETEKIETLEEKQEDRVHDFYLELAPAMTTVSTSLEQKIALEDALYGFVFTVSFGYQK